MAERDERENLVLVGELMLKSQVWNEDSRWALTLTSSGPRSYSSVGDELWLEEEIYEALTGEDVEQENSKQDFPIGRVRITVEFLDDQKRREA